MLLAALEETGLGTTLTKAVHQCLTQVEPAFLPFSHSSKGTHERLVNTLLFLPVAELERTWDLRSYTGKELAFLSDRLTSQAYSYEYTERFLSQLAKSGGAEVLTEKLAGWTAQLWLKPAQAEEASSSVTNIFYIDGHHKPVYSDQLIPRGLVGRLGKVLGCRGMVLLHDQDGHPLLITTGRGDTHLTVGLPEAVKLFERASGLVKVHRMVVDREGMSGAFLEQLVAEGRSVLTILRRNQYQGLDSFSQVGEFVPYSYNPKGQLKREITTARFDLKVKEGRVLPLRVALLREVEPQQKSNGETMSRIRPEAVQQAEKGEELRLIPIVSTASQEKGEASQLADMYKGRWPRQENIIRDWLLPLGLDHHHGYAKKSVENSEVSKRREKMQHTLVNSERYEIAARERSQKASHLHTKRAQEVRKRCDEFNRALGKQQRDLQNRGLSCREVKTILNEQQERNRAELDTLQEAEWRAYQKSHAEWKKAEDYKRKQIQLKAQLHQLEANAREMAELDNNKDQVMTCLVVALTNLGMWIRDHYFPTSYSGAGWERLLPFFKLGGWVSYQTDTVEVRLRGFNNRELNRDVSEMCDKVNKAAVKLGDGRQLLLSVAQSARTSQKGKAAGPTEREVGLALAASPSKQTGSSSVEL